MLNLWVIVVLFLDEAFDGALRWRVKILEVSRDGGRVIWGEGLVVGVEGLCSRLRFGNSFVFSSAGEKERERVKRKNDG
jgi:hypothetical protein